MGDASDDVDCFGFGVFVAGFAMDPSSPTGGNSAWLRPTFGDRVFDEFVAVSVGDDARSVDVS